ncbi:MAG: Gfo/Idh/MocA family oxidoreductase [Nitrospinae bacterium]|nr:Gfo/Idh/MocA family oxidoreductase [Nitrospinota bacterium]
MPKKLQTAIIGYGKVGKIRRECIERHPDLELIAICDIDASLPPSNWSKVFRDWREVLNLAPDIVFVCTTNECIPEIAIAALKRGIHTFCEKPPGRTVLDIQKIREVEQCSEGVKLMFGFNHRYHQSIMDAKALVDRGHLGKILWARGVYGKAGGPGFDKNWRNDPSRSGGGVLIDQGIHMLDLLLWFCGPFQEVKSMVGQAYWNIPVEDNAFAIMRNSQGITAMLHSSATQWQHTFLLEICLEKGHLTASGILSSTRSYGRESLRIAQCLFDEEGYPLPNPHESIDYYDEDKSWELEVKEFIQCIKTSQPVKKGTSENALQAMEMVHLIYAGDAQWNPQADYSAKVKM